MTDERLGPLGRRFLAAFAAVALVTVALVTVAGLVGSEQGLTSQSRSQRGEVADRVVTAVEEAYRDAGGWAGADLRTAGTVAAGGGATLVVRAADGTVMWPERGRDDRSPGMSPMGPGRGMDMGPDGGGPMTDRVTEPVVVDGALVGQVLLGFGSGPGGGRPVAWTWILVAGAVAVLVALGAAWLVSRQLTRPVRDLTRAARSFAAGEGDPVVRERGVGELAELAEAFEEAVTAVRRAEGARARMAADVAHELRTPLAALQAGLEELRDGLAPADPATLARLHDQSMRVSRIVGDLDSLFAAEGATRALRREVVDLGELARREVEGRAAQLRAAGLDVVLDLPPEHVVRVSGDAERLHQVVGNLLQNCARHCRSGDTVSVRVALDGGRPVLRVSDTGPGIAADDLPRVFDRFWRGPQRTGRPGSGLGLAVVRSLVEAMQGTVTAESDGSTGTTFTVTLPAADETEAGSARPQEGART